VVNRTNYYYDFHYPLPLVELILKLLGRGSDPTTSVTETGTREWFSQPREGSSTTTECVTVAFRLPVSVSELSTEILRMPCTVEAWYQDRSNNWRPVLDRQRNPLRVRVSRSDTKSWYKWSEKCYPLVAKKLQLRATRDKDPVTISTAYPLGFRNTLIRRNVYDRADGGRFDDDVDVMGNLVSRYIRDWDASKAADDNYTTFWKSAPQPDPAAVVSLYLDVRDPGGGAQMVEKLYLDPVYSNQHLNIYHTSDDAVGVRNLSPITLAPGEPSTADSGTVGSSTATTVTDPAKSWTAGQWVGQHLFTADGRVLAVTANTATTLTFATGAAPAVGGGYRIGRAAVSNVDWRPGRGLMASPDDPDCTYSWPVRVGTQVGQSAWVGVEWRPDFMSANADLPLNPLLFAAGDPTSATGGAAPQLYYESANRRFVLQFVKFEAASAAHPKGRVVLAAGPFQTAAISEEWLSGDALRIVAGWTYPTGGGTTAHVRVVDGRGRTIAALDSASAGLPDLVTLDGTARVSDFRGAITNLVVKLEDHALSSADFITNPTYYCDPDPVIADDSGRYPSTSLDNAIYAAPFLSREHGSGGSDRSAFEDKEWIPVWRDYIVQKGMLYLPRATSMKYLKLEFTNLTEEPYPIYESGIEVKYKVFPVEVTQTTSLGPRLYTGQGGFLGMGSFISMNGSRSVNWLDPNSVLSAVGSVLTPQTPPVVINTGKPYITDSLPGMGAQAVEDSKRFEVASSYVYSRDTLQPYVLAADQYNTIVKAEGLQAVQPYVDVPWAEIEAANPGAVTKVRSTGTVPIRGTDWWIYPGQQLKVPAAVMRKLTETQTVTERKLTLESRVRFNTTSVHRYEYRTARRDAAVAYFAGLREVQPYASTYVRGEDKPVIDFPHYDPKVWDIANGTVQGDDTVVTAHPAVPAVISSQFETQSDFSRISVAFNDSGLVRSDSMWADPGTRSDFVEAGNVVSATATSLTDPDKSWTANQWVGYHLFTSFTPGGVEITGNGATDLAFAPSSAPTPGTVYWISESDTFNEGWRTGTTIDDDTNLAPYVDTIPSKIPGGTWKDFNATWGAATSTGGSPASLDETAWGATYGVVNVSLDSNRRFMGRRVLHFTRAGGVQGLLGPSGRAGISVGQWNNFVPGSKCRIGCVIYRPLTTSNRLVLGLRDSYGTRIHEETIDRAPTGRWFRHTTGFFNVPETLPHAGFEQGFQGWTASGAPWTVETDAARTRTGGKSARVTTSASVASGLASTAVRTTTGTTVKASAWVRWQGLRTDATAPVIRLRAIFYDNDGGVVATLDLPQNTVTPSVAVQTEWTPVSGQVGVPRGIGAAKVSFKLVVERSAGGGGTVWVDDFSADVPFAPEQEYSAQLTLEGDRREELYVSDLYTEITPVRYYVQLGRRPGGLLDAASTVVWDADPVEVTDLRYTRNTANVTRTLPANAFRLRAVLTSDDATLVGTRIVPHYLK
jgi:hypothetical protein